MRCGSAHWVADADRAHVAAYARIATRHEIDYRGNIGEGEGVTGTTVIRERPRDAPFDRHATFTNAAGKPIAQAKTTSFQMAAAAAPFVP